MRTNWYISSVVTMIFISGCGSREEEKDINLSQDTLSTSQPSVPLASDTLQQTSSTCKQQVEQLWHKRFQVPKQKQKSFHEALGRASSNCNELIEAFKYLHSIAVKYNNYQHSLSNAQSCVNGGIPNDQVFSQPNVPSQNALIENIPLEDPTN